jgi:methylated-DNA-[protein]-cysteine S-methyltransferase
MQTTLSNPIIVSEDDSPIGRLSIALDDGALCALSIGDDHGSFARSIGRHGCVVDAPGTDIAAPVLDALARYFDGDVTAVDDLDVRAIGSAFQRRVWAALREIPVGTTASYVQIAREIGAPNASRAVGRANATNPVALVVPCHRVVRADGTLGGYAGGLERKRWLLEHERRHAGPPSEHASRIASPGPIRDAGTRF